MASTWSEIRVWASVTEVPGLAASFSRVSLIWCPSIPPDALIVFTQAL